MKTIFIPVRDLTRLPSLKKLLPIIKSFNSLSITSTVQFEHDLPRLEGFLRDNGFKVGVCRPVLGCRCIIKPADAVIIITTGVFHAINLSLCYDKPVIIIDPHKGSVGLLGDGVINSFLKKRAVRVHKVISSKNIGILVSTKKGQHNLSLARRVKSVLESAKRTAVILVSDELSPLNINNLSEFDSFINTACPRIVEDDFEKPVVNWSEVEEYFT